MSQSSGNQLRNFLQIIMRKAITKPMLKGGIKAFQPRYIITRDTSQPARMVGIINPNPTIASLCLITTEEIFNAGYERKTKMTPKKKVKIPPIT